MEQHRDTQQVCLSGHQITANYDDFVQHRKSYCPICGAATIYECPSCRHPIKGDYHVTQEFALVDTPVPSHCEKCGKPFPWTEAKLRLTNASTDISPNQDLNLVLQICSRFHLVARQINSRHDNRPSIEVQDEYDVQDLLHSLLHVGFDDIRNEEWTPSYAGSASRLDFLLAKEEIVVEVKKTRSSLKAKQIGEQLIVDIERYRKHPNCKTLVCFVYDPEGRLSNPRGLENDLRKEEGDFSVHVLVVPKGY